MQYPNDRDASQTLLHQKMNSRKPDAEAAFLQREKKATITVPTDELSITGFSPEKKRKTFTRENEYPAHAQ